MLFYNSRKFEKNYYSMSAVFFCIKTPDLDLKKVISLFPCLFVYITLFSLLFFVIVPVLNFFDTIVTVHL